MKQCSCVKIVLMLAYVFKVLHMKKFLKILLKITLVLIGIVFSLYILVIFLLWFDSSDIMCAKRNRDMRILNPDIPKCSFFCPDAEEYEKECGIPDGFTGNVCVENWKVTNYINGRIQYSMNFDASGKIYRVEIYGEDAGEKWYSFKDEYAERTDMPMRDRVYLRSEERYGDCFIRYLPDGNIEHAGFGGYEYRYEYKHGKVVYESVFNRKNDYLLTIYYYNDGSIKRYYERNNGKIIDKEYYKNGSLA